MSHPAERLQAPPEVQTVPQALAHWAKQTPDAIALLAPEREPATYRDLHAAVAHLAAELRARGFGRRDGIALLFPEGADFCVALLAAISVGSAIPLAWPTQQTEERRVQATGLARAVLASTALEVSTRELAHMGLPVISFTAGASGRVGDFRLDGPSVGASAPTESPEPEDLALILHSSGTTGRPKLAPIVHRGITSLCRAVIEARGLTAADRWLGTARTTHSQGVNTLMIPIFAGASLVCIPGLDLAALPRWLRAFRPTYMSTTPAVLRVLAAERGELLDAFRHAPLRCIHSTAGPLSTDETDRLEAMLGAPIFNGYGMTEATGIAGERYAGFQRVPGSVGPPWSSSEVQILDDHDRPVAPGEHGQIVVRGPRVIAGYLDAPRANAAAFLPGGWFRTRDVGYLDENGFLFVTGRVDELINRGGEKIAPVEVDHRLLSHPAVAEAALFAIPDARLGEDLVAAVVLRPGMSATPRELRSWMLDQLSPSKVPWRIWFVEGLPRTPTGKVRRGVLADRFLTATGISSQAGESPQGQASPPR